MTFQRSASIVRIALSLGLLLGGAQAGVSQNAIVTLPDKEPVRSKNRRPDAQGLIETWLDGYGWNADKHFDQERYEIISLDIIGEKQDRALMQFRVLPQDGSAMDLARQRCPGRNTPIEIQIHYEWSEEMGWWTALHRKGDPGFKQCSDEALWTDWEVALIIDPPKPPKPPELTAGDVTTPPVGSKERTSILAAVKPMFEEQLGQEVLVVATELRVAKGWAWAYVAPRQPDGSLISKEIWQKAYPYCELGPDEATAQMWIQHLDGQWRIGWPGHVCATDVMAPLGCYIGAPFKLVGDWAEELSCEGGPPIEEPHFFKYWAERKAK